MTHTAIVPDFSQSYTLKSTYGLWSVLEPLQKRRLKFMDESKLDKVANSTDSLDSLSLIDFAYCYKVRELYNAYKDNKLTLEECKKAKSQIQREYEDLTQTANVYKLYQDGIKKSEQLRVEVNKSDDLNEMLSKCLEMVSLLTGDETFLQCNIRKLGD
jgi:hypothetical protein